MSWESILSDAGLNDREIKVILVLSSKSNLKASELAKELETTRLDAYNSLEKLQAIGLVKTTADRPMRFSCPPIGEAVEHLIGIRKLQLQRIEQAYSEAKVNPNSLKFSNMHEEDIQLDPKFAVLKERTHIMKRIEKMADDSEEHLILLLGKFGILHLCRSPAIFAVNNAASRGINIRVIGQLDRRTLRFYGELDDSIEVRHTENLEAQGALMDNLETIQYLNMEENPVGRGKEDAALVIESPDFSSSWANLVASIWSEGIPFDSASKRFTENRIVDPLKLTFESGSFLERIRDILGVGDNLPIEDTPFDPESILSAGIEINQARKELETGGVQSLSAFGINIETLLRQVGIRIGEELSFSMKDIKGDVEYLNEIMDWWEYSGLGKLTYDIDPVFYIEVKLEQHISKDKLPLWALDDGIIEGSILSRYDGREGISINRVLGEGEDDFHSRYEILMVS
jgi:sugar-specific transcriptional regulator TrmB